MDTWTDNDRHMDGLRLTLGGRETGGDPILAKFEPHLIISMVYDGGWIIVVPSPGLPQDYIEFLLENMSQNLSKTRRKQS